MEFIMIVFAMFIFMISIFILIYSVAEEKPVGFLLSAVLSIISLFMAHSTVQSLIDDKKWLVAYVIEHGCSDEKFSKKFLNEIFEYKKRLIIEKLKKEMKDGK